MGHKVYRKKYCMGAPQGSILRPICFNILFYDLFYFLQGTDIANCVEDTTLCNASLTHELGINEHGETYILFKWFDNNYMNVSSDKSHYLKSIKRVIANIDNNRTGSQDIHGQDIFD